MLLWHTNQPDEGMEEGDSLGPELGWAEIDGLKLGIDEILG